MKQQVPLILLVLASAFGADAADVTAPDLARDRAMRDRYETVLLRNPFQDRSFNAVYEGYASVEGVDAWAEKLKPLTQSGTNTLTALLLLGQIYDRQFKSAEAIVVFEQAGAQGEIRAQFKVLLGTLYYKAGKDEPAAKLLAQSLDALTDLDLDQRSLVCRMLGNLYLRQGKRDEAIAAWKRIAELNPGETLAQTELAEIYQDNRLWDEAIAVYRRIADAAKDDPYRRCRALRSAGDCLVQAERRKEAIAVFEEALGLVAPGTWLFDDLAIRLVGVYEDLGDLSGLVKYLEARLAQAPNDADYRGLLAEVHTRMGRLDLAEREHRAILERNPRNAAVYEKLLAIYAKQDKTNEVVANLEKLIGLFPAESDYVRRLGEAHLRAGDRAKAMETWQRLVRTTPTGERYVELAGWLESFKFTKDAMEAYEQALQQSRNKEWVFRLAALQFKAGAEAEAVKLWLSVLEPQKSKAPDYVEVATILEANQQFEEAGTLRKRAMDLEPANLELRLAYARNLMEQKKFEAALVEFAALAGQEENEYLRAEGGRGQLDAYAELGLLAQKQTEWERELEQNPRSPRLLAQLAQLYLRDDQPDKALRLYERRRDVEPENPIFLRDLAEAYKVSQQRSLAIEAFKKLAETDKVRARAHLKALLDLYLASSATANALATAEKMVALVPSDPEARLDLARVYLLSREVDKGLEQYRSALRLKPDEPEYHRQYGEALAAENRWGEAQAAYWKALDLVKDDEARRGMVQSLARIYQRQGKSEELIAEFAQRIRNTPKRLSAYEELATVYRELGQVAKAVQVMDNAVQTVDDKVPALRSLIRAATEARNLGKARAAFEQLIALSARPETEDYERLAGLYTKLGEFPKATETWQKVLELSANDAKGLRRAALSMRKDGFLPNATAALARVIELDPYDYQSRYDYAQMLVSNGKPDKGLEQLQLVLELGPPKDGRPTQGRRSGRGTRGTSNPFALFVNAQSGAGGVTVMGAMGTVMNFPGVTFTALSGVTYQVLPGGGTPILVSSGGGGFGGNNSAGFGGVGFGGPSVSSNAGTVVAPGSGATAPTGFEEVLRRLQLESAVAAATQGSGPTVSAGGTSQVSTQSNPASPNNLMYVANFNNGLVRMYSTVNGADLGNLSTNPVPGARGIALDAAGNVYVASTSNNSVRRFSPTGSDLGIFAATGISDPRSLAFDRSGNLYIANAGNQTVRRISPAGADLGDFVSSSSGLSVPTGLAFDAAGNLYVASYFANNIRRFDPNGAALGIFIATGLNGPQGIVIGPQGDFFVANVFSGALMRYNASGMMSLPSGTLGQLHGLGMDQAGNLYTSSLTANAVRKFSPSGQDLGDFTSGPGLNAPVFIAIRSPAPSGTPTYVPVGGVSVVTARGGGSSTFVGVPSFGPGFVSGNPGNPTARTWQGTYEEFKPQVILQAANLARTTGREEVFVKSFQNRAEKDPNNTGLKREWLMVLLAGNRLDDALKITDDLLAAEPKDLELLQGAAQFFASRARPDRAVVLYERLLEVGPAYKPQTIAALVPLYFQNNQEAKGVALVDQLVNAAGNANDTGAFASLASSLQRVGRTALAEAVYEKGIAGDPRNRGTLLMNLATLQRSISSTNLDKVAATYRRVLGEPDAANAGRPFAGVYSVDTVAPSPASTFAPNAPPASVISRLRGYPVSVVGAVDSIKLSALTALLALARPNDPFLELEQEARKFVTSTNLDERARAWNVAKLLYAYYLTDQYYDGTDQLLFKLRDPGKEDDEWFNMALHLEHRIQDYAGMVSVYSNWALRNPARAPEILVAKAKAQALADQVASAAKAAP